MIYGISKFCTKGQLISKCPFGVIVSTKIPTIFFRISALLSLYKGVKSKTVPNQNFFKIIKCK